MKMTPLALLRSSRPQFVLTGFSVGSLCLFACSSAPPQLPVQGREGLLSQTAVAQKCEEARSGHEKPFVVEWDATDLASFEAKAARDTVFVKYEGCKLEVLYQCSDPVTAGKLGSYGTPTFTSGTKQGFDIQNQGELYAKLPLGAANLSARIDAGESLHLSYFVAGVATSSREAVFESDMQQYAGCGEATHFVWAYNLGAFELDTVEQSKVEASAEMGVAKLGGDTSHREQIVGSGGKIASCDTQDQRGCRVPIRLVLREITKGQSPVATAPSAPISNGGEGSAALPGAPARSPSQELWDHANELGEKGDGAGCLEYLEKALAQSLQLRDQHQFKTDHAICTMLAGKCDEGTRDFRAAIAAADIKREKQDFQLDQKTREVANQYCPSGTAKEHADFILRADRELRAAAKVNDGKTCEALIKGIKDHSIAMFKEGQQKDFDVRGRAEARAGNDYDIAASCVARATKKCASAKKVLELQCETLEGELVQSCRKAVSASFENKLKSESLECQ